ncbi:indoleacetamide hydrolase [Rhizobium miluonense]|jgi:mandelamide amidase|uniref:Indoleacetamide hydrolase n=1 Tax=Rhizobium miluonense TaxID=411945 RepID=A0ABU1SPR3_9HYPH|nr:indoleacetamide hydrolase [Rhizobium miluonense]MDR6900969.1 mandelamide amidase [Rhizobium miluonense]
MTLKAFTLTEIAAAMARGRLSAEEFVTDLLMRKASLASINAFVSLDEERALRDARQADAERATGQLRGALHGLPIAFKDNINVAGYVTTGGTPALRNFRPVKDAPVAAWLLKAGAIAYGKNGMHELAYGATSANVAYGAPRNPFDQARTSGGSSGGSGAAVGARLVPASIGTDTGGSVRIPAAFCGAWGYRPTTGRWPTAGIVPISTTRDTPGPITLSATDMVLLDSVVTSSSPVVASAIKGTRLGIPHKHFWDLVDSEVAAICMEALQRLVAEGAELVEVDSRALPEPYAAAAMSISIYEGTLALSAFLSDHDIPLTFAEVADQVASPDVREILLAQLNPATAISPLAYEIATTEHLPALTSAYADIFKANRIDALAFPVCRLPAPELDQSSTVVIAGKVLPIFPALIHNTDIGSVASLPGVSVPGGLTRAGLPVGLGLDFPFEQDQALLAFSLAIETLFPIPSPPA